MKNSFFRFYLFACIPLFSVACSHTEKLSNNEFLIEGRVFDVEDGAVIDLLRWDGDAGEIIASDTVKNGRFLFKEETISDMERLTINSWSEGFSSMSLGVWVAPSAKINISGKGKLHILWNVKSRLPYQKEENRYTDNSRKITIESTRLFTESNILRAKARKTTSENEALIYTKTADSLEIIRKSLMLKELYADITVMEKTNMSPIWMDKMRGITQMLMYGNLNAEDDGELRKKAVILYNNISEEDLNTHLGHLITVQLFPPLIVEIGDDMADADFFDINGNMTHISNYLGKYLLLDFWSSGCGPCIAALPEMKEVFETNSDNLSIISIGLDVDTRWKKSISEHDMPWVNIHDPKAMGGLSANYGARGIPFYVIISPEGKVIDKWSGYGRGIIKRKINEFLPSNE